MPSIYTPQAKTRNGLRIIEMRTPRKGYRRKDILINLRQMSEKLGKYPNHQEWTKLGGKPSTCYIYKIFGDWKNAVSEAKALRPKFVYRLEMKRANS